MGHLVRLNQMKKKNYYELFPGVLTKGYRNAESVYIEDDIFVFLRPAIKMGMNLSKVLIVLKFQWRIGFRS